MQTHLNFHEMISLIEAACDALENSPRSANSAPTDSSQKESPVDCVQNLRHEDTACEEKRSCPIYNPEKCVNVGNIGSDESVDTPLAKKARKCYTNTCCHEGCTNIVVKGGICIRHGAKVKRVCSHEGCTNRAIKGGVYIRHRAKVKTSSHEGYTNGSKKGGVCLQHGAKLKTCSHEGCINRAKKGGIYRSHRAKLKACSREGCINGAKRKEGSVGNMVQNSCSQDHLDIKVA